MTSQQLNELSDLILAYGDSQAEHASSTAGFGTDEYLTLRARFIDSARRLQARLRELHGEDFTLMPDLDKEMS